MDVYRERLIRLYKNPLNFGELKDADLKSQVSNVSCGDEVDLYIKKASNGRITDIKFKGQSCAICTASSSLVTEYLKGKSIDEAKKVNKEKVIELLGVDLTKNPTRLKCALLILDALKKLKL
ncbi:MAG: iron-sulfur cluster assembly scaffold protein [Candidatus Micrarchaeota archaeon]